jgi:hypothetical protein
VTLARSVRQGATQVVLKELLCSSPKGCFEVFNQRSEPASGSCKEARTHSIALNGAVSEHGRVIDGIQTQNVHAHTASRIVSCSKSTHFGTRTWSQPHLCAHVFEASNSRRNTRNNVFCFARQKTKNTRQNKRNSLTSVVDKAECRRDAPRRDQVVKPLRAFGGKNARI